FLPLSLSTQAPSLIQLSLRSGRRTPPKPWRHFIAFPAENQPEIWAENRAERHLPSSVRNLPKCIVLCEMSVYNVQ
ncbi:MAG: hypothetical protein ACI4WX_01940, partial [Aristaeellaceae bacterium]